MMSHKKNQETKLGNKCKLLQIMNDEIDYYLNYVMEITYAPEDSMKKKIESLRSENKSLKREIESLRSNAESYRLEIEPLKAENKSPRAGSKSLRPENESLKREIEALRSNVESFRLEIESLKAENKSLKTENKSPSAGSKSLRPEIESLKIEKAKNIDLENTLNGEREQKNQLKLDVDRLRKLLHSQQSIISSQYKEAFGFGE